jgi:dTDP-4-dehydrorhamnose reductase
VARGAAAGVIKTAVIGASGYVGRHLWQAYRSRYPDCVGTTFSADRAGLARFDLRAPDLAALRLEETGHEAVLIASAKPNITYCEEHRAAAHAVNVEGTLDLAWQIGRTSMQAIFLSSDYVFAGDSGPHDDDDPPRPGTEYGRQKAMVERELPSVAASALVLRLSKIYGVHKGDRTLLDEMAGALVGGQEVRAARDQKFCPTNVADLVRLVLAVQAKGLRGIVNACNPEGWSRADIAFAMAEGLNADRSLVKPISLHDLPAMVGRPLDTRMRSSRLQREVRPTFTPLRDDILRVATSWKRERPASADPAG